MVKVVTKDEKADNKLINIIKPLDQKVINHDGRKVTVIPATAFKVRIKSRPGRPTKYNPKFCRWVIEYFQESNPVLAIVDDPGGKGGTQTKLETIRIPTVRGFASSIGVNQDTIYEWSKQYVDFSEAFARACAIQDGIIEELALAGRIGKGIGELYFLNRLGYKDSRQLDITSGGEKLPTPITALQLNVNSPSAHKAIDQ